MCSKHFCKTSSLQGALNRAVLLYYAHADAHTYSGVPYTAAKLAICYSILSLWLLVLGLSRFGFGFGLMVKKIGYSIQSELGFEVSTDILRKWPGTIILSLAATGSTYSPCWYTSKATEDVQSY